MSLGSDFSRAMQTKIFQDMKNNACLKEVEGVSRNCLWSFQALNLALELWQPK